MTRAYCCASVTVTGKYIILTLKLYHNETVDRNKRTDSNITSVSISCDTPVESGYTYTLEVSGWIDGVAIDGVPVSAMCP